MQYELLGKENQPVADTLRSLAYAIYWQGKPDQAQPLCRESLRITRKLVGSNSLAVVERLHLLGFAVGDQHRLKEGEALLREALTIRRKPLPRELETREQERAEAAPVRVGSPEVIFFQQPREEFLGQVLCLLRPATLTSGERVERKPVSATHASSASGLSGAWPSAAATTALQCVVGKKPSGFCGASDIGGSVPQASRGRERKSIDGGDSFDPTPHPTIYVFQSSESCPTISPAWRPLFNRGMDFVVAAKPTAEVVLL